MSHLNSDGDIGYWVIIFLIISFQNKLSHCFWFRIRTKEMVFHPVPAPFYARSLRRQSRPLKLSMGSCWTAFSKTSLRISQLFCMKVQHNKGKKYTRRIFRKNPYHSKMIVLWSYSLFQDYLRELWKQMNEVGSGLELLDHRYKAKTYDNCLIASDLCDWMIKTNKASNRWGILGVYEMHLSWISSLQTRWVIPLNTLMTIGG